MCKLSSRITLTLRPPDFVIGSSSVLDEWEQKLLGKKSAVPYISPNNQAAKSETLSIQSSTHSSRSNTLERQKVKSTLPTNVLPLPTHEVNLDIYPRFFIIV